MVGQYGAYMIKINDAEASEGSLGKRTYRRRVGKEGMSIVWVWLLEGSSVPTAFPVLYVLHTDS